MAKNNEARFTADIQDFEQKVDKMTKSITNFSSKGIGSMNGLIGAFGRMVPAVGAAVGAAELFGKAVENNQSLSDSFSRASAGMTTSIDNFFSSLTSGDWSVFERGIMNVIQKAGEAADALDQLANSQMSLGVINAKENLELQRYLTTLKSTKKGTDEWNEAMKGAQSTLSTMREASSIVQSDTWDALRKQIAKGQNMGADEIQFDWVLNAQTLDASSNRDAFKEKARSDVKTYQEEIAKLNKEYFSMSGSGVMGGMGFSRTLNSGKSYDDYAAKMKSLNQTYGQSITYVTMLEKLSDDQLQKLDNLTQSYYQLETHVEGVNQQLARLGKETGGGGGGGGAKPDTSALQKAMAQAAIDAFTPDTWQMVNDAIDRLPPLQVPIELTPTEEEDEEAFAARYDNDKIMEPWLKQQEAIKKTLEAQKEWDAFNRGAMQQGISSLTGAVSTLGDVIGGTAGSVLSLVGSLASQVSGGIMAIASLKMQEEAHKANMRAALGDAAANAMAAHSAIPFVGVAMGVGLVATIVSTISSLPKFAQGGIATGPTYGLFGENGPEAVIPLDRLSQMIGNGNDMQGINGKVNFSIKNQELVGTLNNASQLAQARR